MLAGLLGLLPSFILPALKLFGGKMGQAVDAETERRRIASDERVAYVQAQGQVYAEWMRSQPEILAEDNKFRSTRYVRPLFGYSAGLYFSWVLFYSAFLCRECVLPQAWEVAAPPPSIAQAFTAIVVTYFGGRVIEKVGPPIANTIAGAIKSRRRK